MIEYQQFNINPRKRKTGDCVIRAIATAAEIPYSEAAKLLFDEWMESGYEMTDTHTTSVVLLKLGFIIHKKPFKLSGKTYTVGEMDELIDRDYNAIIQVANHYTCICDGSVKDLWDCRNKSVYRYWVRLKR